MEETLRALNRPGVAWGGPDIPGDAMEAHVRVLARDDHVARGVASEDPMALLYATAKWHCWTRPRCVRPRPARPALNGGGPLYMLGCPNTNRISWAFRKTHAVTLELMPTRVGNRGTLCIDRCASGARPCYSGPQWAGTTI